MLWFIKFTTFFLEPNVIPLLSLFYQHLYLMQIKKKCDEVADLPARPIEKGRPGIGLPTTSIVLRFLCTSIFLTTKPFLNRKTAGSLGVSLA